LNHAEPQYPVSGRSIDLFFTPNEVTEEKLRTYKNVVVIDVLRSATTIAMALHNGARAIIPVASSSAATSLAKILARDDVLLCGEREGRMIDGFHLGNSPSEYTRERIRGRTLVFASTNGTPAILRAVGAGQVFFCGFVNLPSVIEAVFSDGEPLPLAIVCSGKVHRFAIEDAVCGGKMIEKMIARDGSARLNDAARVALFLNEKFGSDVTGLLHESDHGKFLSSIGLGSDLTHCAAPGVLTEVPTVVDGQLIKWESA
jgi:2-phosphosulfolactate phosphatase